jgi:acyl-homoserine-lactone acylase
VKLNPNNRDQYLLDGQPRDFKKVEEIIQIKGSTPAKRTIYETIHGPVFAREGNMAFAAGMSLYSSDVGCEQLLRMVLSRDVKEFRKALSLRQLDGANVFCADDKGSIFYGWTNRLMVRNDKYNWEKTVDGSTSDTLYRELLPFEQMPQSMNDAGGYYQASNGADWMLEEGAWGLKPSDFPKWLLSTRNRRYLSARPQRVVDLLRSRPRHTLDQTKEMALDTRVVAAEWVMPALERAVSELGEDDKPEVGEAMSILRRWVKRGPTATMTSKGYSIFREICAQLGRGSNVVDARNILGLPERVTSLPLKNLRQLHSALLKAVDQLVVLYGTVSVEWGKINVIELADGRQFPCGAGDAITQTPWQGTQNQRGKDGKWRVNGGSDFMMLTELGCPPTIYTLVPYGQSDDPRSRHFADQTERWAKGSWKRAWFTLEDIKRESKSKKDITD